MPNRASGSQPLIMMIEALLKTKGPEKLAPVVVASKPLP
jgi:hypothetical protein